MNNINIFNVPDVPIVVCSTASWINNQIVFSAIVLKCFNDTSTKSSDIQLRLSEGCNWSDHQQSKLPLMTQKQLSSPNRSWFNIAPLSLNGWCSKLEVKEKVLECSPDGKIVDLQPYAIWASSLPYTWGSHSILESPRIQGTPQSEDLWEPQRNFKTSIY